MGICLETNLHERGFDVAFATLIFDGPTFEVEDHRREYGERRIVAIGVADDFVLEALRYPEFQDDVERKILEIARRRIPTP